MISHPSRISSSNMAFIMVWKVAGELVIPKNITVGSKSPWFVINVAFHSSPVQIWMLLYPHCMSNLVNKVAPRALAINSGMSGKGYQFQMVHLLSHR